MAKDDRKAKILERAEREKVKFMRLQFTDILGALKNVEVPDRQFEEALDGRIMFDGSSIEGFVRIEESDMYLKAGPEHLPGVSMELRWRRTRRACHLRYRESGRNRVRRLPPHRVEARHRPCR